MGCQYITDDTLNHLCAPQLCFLNLGHCNISDTGIASVCTNCTEIRSLVLTGCWELTDSCVINSLTNLHHLQHIDLGGCSGITDENIVLLSNRCPLRSITLMNHGVSCSAIKGILKGAKDLEELDLESCEGVNEDLLRFLENFQCKLKKIYLTGCNVSPLAIAKLQKYCPHIEILKQIPFRVFQKKCLLLSSKWHNPDIQNNNVKKFKEGIN